jgi:uncharacterized protein
LVELNRARPRSSLLDASVIRLRVHVHPGSRRPGVGGSHDGALNVHVAARAVDGAATAEVLEGVAHAFGVKARDVRLVSGARSRTKHLVVDGDEATLTARLAALLELA